MFRLESSNACRCVFMSFCMECPCTTFGPLICRTRVPESHSIANRPFTPSLMVRMLLNTRFFIGRIFGWDGELGASACETFATRLTIADRSQSLAPAGTREGPFSVVYRFENEQLLELVNRTAHAGALSTLVETTNGYRFYFGVYVRNVSHFTPLYMAVIDPFRKWIVYPSLLCSVRARWNHEFSTT